MKNEILVAGKEKLIMEGLKFSLEQEGYIVDTAYGETETLQKIAKNSFNLIIIDMSSGKEKSFQVLKAVRKSMPIIALTDNVEDMDKVAGIECGACEFIQVPINIQELKSRVRAAINRAEGTNVTKDGIIKLWNLTVDTKNKKVYSGNREIRFSSREYDILELLVMNKNKVYSREELLKKIWGSNYKGDKRIVDVHIRRLREKLEMDPGNPSYLMTKWGEGYYFNG